MSTEDQKINHRTAPPTADESISEMSWTINRFDRIAVKNAFKTEYDDLSKSDVVVALVFTHLRRQGQQDAVARQTAFEMSTRNVLNYFADEDEESGKDSTG